MYEEREERRMINARRLKGGSSILALEMLIGYKNVTKIRKRK